MPGKTQSPVEMEQLEGRQMLSAAALSTLRTGRALPEASININLSRMRTNQSEGAVAINPANPQQIFAMSNLESGAGLFSATSTDGGLTWSKKIIANGKDGLIAASCDPSAAFDQFGNLFISYLNLTTNAVVVAKSSNGGKTFTRLAKFAGDVDQPTVTTGPGSVWITFAKDDVIRAAGARVSGLGTVSAFSTLQSAPGSGGGNFGDIAVGPKGQVLVTYMLPTGGAGPAKIFVNLDRDGLGPKGFGPAVLGAKTEVGGFRAIPAQRSATIDAEPGLGFDANRPGRVYLVYTSVTGTSRNNTDVFLRVSRDDGMRWGKPLKVNDDATSNSQFLPRIAVDQTSGNVAVSWYDSRNDNGKAPGSTNKAVNDDAQFYGVIARPNTLGLTFSPNFQISRGTSNAARSGNQIDLGDYTGLAFHDGLMVPIWADNSNSTLDNPDGQLRTLDLYVARVTGNF